MSSRGEGLVPISGEPVAEQIPEEYREEYPYIGARNWRYKQEVSEVVADHLDDTILATPVTGVQVAGLLGDIPFDDGQFVRWGSTRYCHPSVHEGMDWFNADVEGNLARYHEVSAQQPRPNAVLVNGWGYRQVFERQAGERVFWITQPIAVGRPETVKRTSGQAPAGLSIWVSAAGLASRSVGLFAETVFSTDNEYISFADVLMLAKISPNTGNAETPYHRLADDRDAPEYDVYKGCRPKDGTLFVANKLAQLVIGHTVV